MSFKNLLLAIFTLISFSSTPASAMESTLVSGGANFVMKQKLMNCLKLSDADVKAIR